MSVQSEYFSPLPDEMTDSFIHSTVNATDAGWYKCEARNHGGRAEDKMFINISCNEQLYLLHIYCNAMSQTKQS